jgi:hypothetical protein
MRGSLLVIAVLGVACSVIESASGQPASDDAPHVDQHYADFGFLPPPNEYRGRVFFLSQKYPTKMPPASEVPEFLKIDFQLNWREYLLAARDYCFRDNILGGDVENDFDAALRERPTWFHVPWQHYGPFGREGVHGLTKEAPVQPQQLAESQTYQGGQTYAVGLYNALGGYTIGQVWADKVHPDAKKARFPNGTVVMKILFTDVPPEQVPSLVNPLQWNAYVTENFSSKNRVFKKLSLVQMDLMVRDGQSPHGWVFGNFQYNGAMNKENKWENLVPLGIQWGNDPHISDNDFTNKVPKQTKRNPNLKETVINPDDDELPPTHLGWNGRLNGPVDNYMSSCMSCHMTAEAPTKSPMSPLFQSKDKIPPVGSTEWMRWFQNLNCGERFDKDQPTTSTDFSLQLAQSLQNYYDWRNAANKMVANRYKRNQRLRTDPDKEFKVQRDLLEQP